MRLSTKYQKVSASSVITAIPPTTPPTMGPVFEEGGLVLGVPGPVEMEVVDDVGVAVEEFRARDDVTLPFCTKRPLWASQHAAVCLSSASQQ